MGQLVFVTGGVRSGKSHFAESLVRTYANEAAYIATSEAFDEEMTHRIQKHRTDRQQQSFSWTLYEMPYTLTETISQQTILFECATTWFTNMYFMKQQHDAMMLLKQWIMVMKQQHSIVIVSNEMLDSGLTPYKETNDYLQQIGTFHQWLVAESDEVYECTNQLVKRWK